MIKIRKLTKEEIKQITSYKKQTHSIISEWKHQNDGTKEWVSEEFESEGTKIAQEEPSIPTKLSI